VIRKGLGSSGGGDYKMELLHSGKASCLFGDGGAHGINYEVSSGPNLADGRWHEISCL
jgi:prepilin-type processing-associated H-X9-DG protein